MYFPSDFYNFPRIYNKLNLLLLHLLNLQRRVLKDLTDTTLHHLPIPKLNLRRPRQNAHPRLDIIMDLQHHIVRISHLARWRRDLVFRFRVLQLDSAPAPTSSAFEPDTLPFPSPKHRQLTSTDQHSSPSRSLPTSSWPPAQH